MESTHQRTFSCHCGAEVTTTLRGLGCYNVGEAEQNTGWTHIALHDGLSAWLCTDCATKAKKLAADLIAVVGTGDFPIRWLAQK